LDKIEDWFVKKLFRDCSLLWSVEERRNDGIKFLLGLQNLGESSYKKVFEVISDAHFLGGETEKVSEIKAEDWKKEEELFKNYELSSMEAVEGQEQFEALMRKFKE